MKMMQFRAIVQCEHQFSGCSYTHVDIAKRTPIAVVMYTPQST